jgi:hypothetical protein
MRVFQIIPSRIESVDPGVPPRTQRKCRHVFDQRKGDAKGN